MDTKNYIIEKSNILNSMQIEVLKDDNMTLNELRFFSLYISKLNAREPNRRTVCIPITEFEELFNVKLNTTQFEKKMVNILHRVVSIQKEDCKKSLATLYSKFEWSNTIDCKEIEITCNYDIFPYLFELKRNYTSYIICNIAKLNTVSKIRLYEICKQYEKIKVIKIELEKLKKMIYCDMTDFRFFNQKVLKPAITDINKYTDVFVSYEKVLQMRKVVAIKFTIASQHREQNKTIQPPIQQPRIDMNIKSDTNDTQCITNVPKLTYNLSDDDINTLSELCANQVKNANDCELIIKNVIVLYNTNSCQKKINSPLAYARKILNSEIEKYLYNTSKTPKGYEPAPPGRVWNERADGTYELISIEKSKRGGNKFTTYDTSPEAMKRLDEINRERIEAAVKQFEEQKKNAHPL